MPTINDLTLHLALALPHPDNDLPVDVLRLRDALTKLDTIVAGKATPTDITAAISNLVNHAPAALDTIRELATAVANDPNYAANIAEQITSIQNNISTLHESVAMNTSAVDTNTANITKVSTALKLFKIINSQLNYLVRGNELAANNFTVQGTMELMPSATLQILNLATVDGVLDTIDVNTTVSDNRLAVDTLYLCNDVTLTVTAQGTIEVTDQIFYI